MKIKCNCSCHEDPNVIHFVACCDNGYRDATPHEEIAIKILEYLEENKIPYNKDDISDYYKRFDELLRKQNNDSDSGVSEVGTR